MKLSGLALAAMVAFTPLVAMPALAQTHVDQRHVEVQRTVTTTREGPGMGHKWRRHRVCRPHWYHHRKVRRCTWHRY